MRTLDLPGEPHVLDIDRPVSVPRQLARALRRARGRSQGALPPGREATLTPIEVHWRGIQPDRARLARYHDVCAHPDDGTLPPTWIETLFQGPMAVAVTSTAFPFSPLGVIHLRQTIAPRRPVSPDETLDAVCRMDAIRETDRGFEVDMRMELRSGDEVPWTGVATLLSRNAATRGRTRSQGERTAPEAETEGWRTVTVEASADLGRRYAAASGDYNPHHMYPLTARLFGYKRPIAQGIWTLGRVLAELELPLPWAAEVAWKRPVFLPSTVALRLHEAGDTVQIEVRHAHRGVPHLVGTVTPG